MTQYQRPEALSKTESNEGEESRNTILRNLTLSRHPDYSLTFPLGNGKVIDIVLNQISFIKSDDISSHFHFQNGSNKSLAIRLRDCEKLLTDYGFLRTHRSYMINCSCIKKLQWTREGEMSLTCGANIPLSRRKKEEIEAYLSKLGLTHLLKK